MRYVLRLRELGIMPKATVIFFVLTLGLISFTESAYADINISTCQTLDIPGETYFLTSDIKTTEKCFIITADGITLHGNGHKLVGDASGELGDDSGDFGIHIISSNGVTIQNMDISYWAHGIEIESSDETTVKNNYIHNINKYGVQLDGSNPEYNLVYNNYFQHSQNAVHAWPSDANYNSVYLNTFFDSNHEQVHWHGSNCINEAYHNNFIDAPDWGFNDECSGGDNQFYENWYNHYDEPSEGCDDVNSDNFCDDPFFGKGNQDDTPYTTQNGWGSPGAPLTPEEALSSDGTPPPPQPPGGTPPPADSDGDGIPDSSDDCPADPENINGFEDTDGCPDTAPPTSDPTTPVLDSAELISGAYNLAWTSPETSLGGPTGGYDIFHNGVDTNDEYRTTNLQTQIDDLDTSVPHCFAVQARWTQTDDYPVSNEICVPPGEIPATVPGAPTNLAASPVSSSQVDLSWSAPSNNGGESITGYKIEVKIGNDPWSTLETNAGTSTSYSDLDLPSDTTCTYRVSAINSMGTSVPSTETSATTHPSEEPQPTGETQSSDPTTPVLDSAELSLGIYNLAWTSPETSLGGPTGGYDIFHNGVDTNKKYRTTSLQTQIGNLDTSIEHCFAVQARWTQTGDYPESNEICVPPMESTTPPTATTVTLTVEAFDFSGNSLGQWNVLRLDGTIIGTGYAPESYTIVPGTEYNLHMANYKQYSFDRWETGSTNSHRTFSITSDTTFTAFFQVS